MTRARFALVAALFAPAPALAVDSPPAFVLTSTDTKEGATLTARQVWKGFGCTGENVSPQLAWKNAPSGTKSFAVTVYDPDAPTGSGWWHWLVYNLPASTTSLPSGSGDPSKKLLPSGAATGQNDFGTGAFGGPCPPVGDKPHRYIFTVFALKAEKLEIPANASAALIGFNLHAAKLATATMTAKFGR